MQSDSKPRRRLSSDAKPARQRKSQAKSEKAQGQPAQRRKSQSKSQGKAQKAAAQRRKSQSKSQGKGQGKAQKAAAPRRKSQSKSQGKGQGKGQGAATQRRKSQKAQGKAQNKSQKAQPAQRRKSTSKSQGRAAAQRRASLRGLLGRRITADEIPQLDTPRLSDTDRRTCRCVLHVAAATPDTANPYAVCVARVRGAKRYPRGQCGATYDYARMSDSALAAFALTHVNVDVPVPYNRAQLLRNIARYVCDAAPAHPICNRLRRKSSGGGGRRARNV